MLFQLNLHSKTFLQFDFLLLRYVYKIPHAKLLKWKGCTNNGQITSARKIEGNWLSHKAGIRGTETRPRGGMRLKEECKWANYTSYSGHHGHNNSRLFLHIHLSWGFLPVPRLPSNRLFVSPIHPSFRLNCFFAAWVKGNFGDDCESNQDCQAYWCTQVISPAELDWR